MTEPLKPEKITELEKVVDNSRFPFQLRIEHEVTSASWHQWSVASREHPWMDKRRTPNKEHFLDLILESGRQRMAVECKRTQQASWVFLTDPGDMPAPEVGRPQIRARLFFASELGNKGNVIQTWWDFDVRPNTVESEFCVVRGSGEDQTPLLERLARHVVDAAQEIGQLALSFGEGSGSIVVIPVIVTNAKLYACPADPAEVSLGEGKLKTPRFVELPYIRFRKSLAQDLARAEKIPRSVKEADENRQRTVFIVNSENLIPMLRSWTLRPMPDGDWPHNVLK